MRDCTKCKLPKEESEFYQNKPGKKQNSWCKECTRKLINARHELKKMKLAEEAGGKCSRCGWHENLRALTFHHPDPTKKDFGISAYLGHKLDELREEAKKCDLLCMNCHTIVHLVEIDEEFTKLIKTV